MEDVTLCPPTHKAGNRHAKVDGELVAHLGRSIVGGDEAVTAVERAGDIAVALGPREFLGGV